MKKIIAVLFVVALCVPSLFADGEHGIMSATNATFSTSYSTPTSSPCDLAYVLINTTGVVAGLTLTIRDGSTTKFTVNIAKTTAGNTIIDLTATPVLFATSLNLVASDTDAGVSYTVVYRKRN